MPFHCAAGAFSRNEEPSLDELLAEPAVRLLMASDRVDVGNLRRLAVAARERCRQSRAAPLAPGSVAAGHHEQLPPAEA
jgi:hypothetical protein